MSLLFQAAAWRNLTLPNRIVIAPMCQYSALDGCTTDWHTIHLGNLAMSSAGLLLVEATAVEPIGRITPQDVGLWDDVTEAALKRTLDAIRPSATTPIGIQLAHAGRKASTRRPWEGGDAIPVAEGGWQTVSASDVAFGQWPAPMALDAGGLARVRDAFAASARRAVRLGFEAIELHMAHGYLLHQFLSPLANRRSDEYGGSLENRLRFPLEVFAAVREVVPAGVPVGVRVSATDWVAGGWDIEGTVALAAQLRERNVDFFHVSSGGLSPEQTIPVGPGYQVALAAEVKRRTGVNTVAVGLITEPHQAETILATGQADAIAIARAALYDPRWPWHAAAELGAQISAPPQYLRSQPHQLKRLFG
ncbi:NADH:flavin oxidoreductase/NADH oxidase [Chitinasiproducens palmae]|uniref:2,4-dienoyl-CoA reductase n=1 Tax=Chitinasiproducens palmae TaxID=1770053 RepID=A0A1H2PP35_9BURK|nr:NADH:flavin oxidoreductase/NADH oxidase [Chitinasiproducens palmae]SDV48502.1 2,4-dienoyl-CoA reductase [Chitinasiproducens palmae]